MSIRPGRWEGAASGAGWVPSARRTKLRFLLRLPAQVQAKRVRKLCCAALPDLCAQVVTEAGLIPPTSVAVILRETRQDVMV